MRKIPTIFQRDSDTRRVTRAHTPGCEWVFRGEGAATRKYDGTCVMLDEAGAWWARREVRPGKRAPDYFVPVEEDRVTGKVMGWEPIHRSPFFKWHADALANMPGADFEPGTYELVGPRVNGNPELVDRHLLIEHATAERMRDVPTDWDALRDYLHALPYEGVVFHHPDGRMAKIKRKDFPRGPVT